MGLGAGTRLCPEPQHTLGSLKSESSSLILTENRDGDRVSPSDGVPSQVTAAEGGWLWGEGPLLPRFYYGFSGSANCGIWGLSSPVICSQPSLQANGSYPVTFLPFSLRLPSSRGRGPSTSWAPIGTAHKGTTTAVQELNQPETMSLLGQAPGHLGNAVCRLKPT